MPDSGLAVLWNNSQRSREGCINCTELYSCCKQSSHPDLIIFAVAQKKYHVKIILRHNKLIITLIMNTINSGSSCQIDGAMRLIVIVSATIYCVVYLGRGFLGSTNSANEGITSSSSNVVESMLAHDVTSTENDSLTRGFDEELFQQTWQDIKANLCPNSLPSHEKYGKKIIYDIFSELFLCLLMNQYMLTFQNTRRHICPRSNSD